ncbi:MAG: hypothetical protein ACRDRT_01685 [Pseudonocardiaceae bacterium]
MTELALGVLQIPPRDFREMTLSDVFLAWRGYHERQDEEYVRIGRLTATIVNVNRDAKKHPIPFTPVDIFPHLARRLLKRRRHGQ